MGTDLANPAAYGRQLKENAILSATPEQLIVHLYDGALRALRAAAAALKEGRIEPAHHALRRAERVIRYLDSIVNDQASPELARHLHGLYAFSLRHLNEARLVADPEKVQAVARVLGELREAWSQVAGR